MTNEVRKASFASRILTVLALTIFFVFTALVAVDNNELEKIFPPSTVRSLSLLAGYSVAILSSNYLMAIRGKNFTFWKIEILISINFIIFFLAILSPWLFPLTIQLDTPWYKPLSDSTKSGQNYWFYGVFILQLPLLWVTFKKIRYHFSSQ